MDDPVISHATEVRRAPTGRVAVQLNLGVHPDELPRRPRWVAVSAVDGQIHVEILDDADVAQWPILEPVRKAKSGD